MGIRYWPVFRYWVLIDIFGIGYWPVLGIDQYFRYLGIDRYWVLTGISVLGIVFGIDQYPNQYRIPQYPIPGIGYCRSLPMRPKSQKVQNRTKCPTSSKFFCCWTIWGVIIINKTFMVAYEAKSPKSSKKSKISEIAPRSKIRIRPREYYQSIDLGELYKLCSHRTRIYTKCQTLKIFFSEKSLSLDCFLKNCKYSMFIIAYES